MHIHVANPVITSNDQLSSKRYSGTWLPSSYGSIIIFQAVSKASLEWSPLQSERKGWSFGRVNTGGFERFGLKATLNAFPTWIDLNAATWSHNCKGCKDLWPRAKRKGRWRGNPPQTASTCECFQASSVFREENFYLRRDVKHIIQWNQRSEGKVREEMGVFTWLIRMPVTTASWWRAPIAPLSVVGAISPMYIGTKPEISPKWNKNILVKL